MKILIIVLLLMVPVCGQSFDFPEKPNEFVGTFPAKPVIETVSSNGKTGSKATLTTDTEALKIETLAITPTEAAAIERMDEKQLGSAATNHGIDNGFENATVTTGRSELGRYAKLQGYKTLNNARLRFEIFFFYGKKEVFTMSVVSPSNKFPTPGITKFLDSLRLWKVQTK